MPQWPRGSPKNRVQAHSCLGSAGYLFRQHRSLEAGKEGAVCLLVERLGQLIWNPTWIEVDESGKIAEIRAYIPTTRDRLMAAAIAAMG